MALTGCASLSTTKNNAPLIPPMTLNANSDFSGLNNQLILMTLKIKNNAQLKFNPTVQTIDVQSGSTFAINQFTLGKPCHVANGYKIYLLSFSLRPGDYELVQAEGSSTDQQQKVK